MFGHKHYVPILKAKDGDYGSLRYLNPGASSIVTPLIEAVPPTPARSELGQLQITVRRLQASWPGKPAFVDLLWREPAGLLPTGNHVVKEFFDLAETAGLQLIPVTSPTRTPAYQQAIQQVVQSYGRGFAIRVPAQLFGNLPALNSAIDGLLLLTSSNPQDVDVILDYRSIIDIEPLVLSQVIGLNLQSIPHLTEWRTLTVASGSFPPSVTIYPQSAWTSVVRREWLAWNSLIGAANKPARLPSYGDYVVGDPGLPFSGRATISANMRYSAGDYFLIWRGFATNTHALGNGQMYAICSSLVARSDFAGQSFSRGDSEIFARSTNQGSTGGAREWRQWATNHYIELLASQIASLP